VDDVILCRKDAPLVTLAYQLIRRGIGCQVEGRDIGRGIMAMLEKYKIRSLDRLKVKIVEYADREAGKLMAKGKEMAAAAIMDKAETATALIDGMPKGSTIDDLRARVATIFGDTEEGERPRRLTLSTIHKAKGREWGKVYLYGRNAFMPSKYARQEWQLQQEYNLAYVAVTRAQKELVEVLVKK
jgi:superfamily I DNA/RNA helicase